VDKRAETERIITGVLSGGGTVAVLAIVGRITGWWPVTQILTWIGEGVVGLALGFVAWGLYPTAVRVIRGHGMETGPTNYPSIVISEPKAHLELIPRTHWPGHIIPPQGAGRIKGDPHFEPGSTLQDWSDPGAKNCKGSQRWDTIDPRGLYKETDPKGEVRRRVRQENRLFYLKLAAIEVRALGETAHDCVAEFRFRTLRDPSEISVVGSVISSGHLNWFSQEIRDGFLHKWHILRRVLKNPAYNFHHLIRNQRQEIHGGKSLDLMLFYTVNDFPGIYACGEGHVRRIAGFSGNKQAKFDAEVTVSGRNVTAFKSVFRVAVARDDFRLERRDGDL
jgi:hypothetical protein